MSSFFLFRWGPLILPPAAPLAAHASQSPRHFFLAEGFIRAALFRRGARDHSWPALPHAFTQRPGLFFPPCPSATSLALPMRLALLLALLCAAHAQVSYYNVSLLWGQPGVSGTVAQGRLNKPQGLAVTRAGDVLVADYGNLRVANISAGKAAYVAGSATPGYKNGAAAASELCGPQGLAWDSDLGLIVTDACPIGLSSSCYRYSSIRKIQDKNMSTIGSGFWENTPPVGGTCGACQCTAPGISGLLLGCWRPCSTAGYKDGKLFTAAFNVPKGVAFATGTMQRGDLYLVDSGNHLIRRVSAVAPSTSNTETLAGSPLTAAFINGPGTAARFNLPSDISRGGDDSQYWIADTGNHAIRLLVDSANDVSVFTVGGGGSLAGFVNADAVAGLSSSNSGPGRFNSPRAVRYYSAGGPSGVAYVADTGNKVCVPIVLLDCWLCALTHSRPPSLPTLAHALSTGHSDYHP